ncbi:hypothetical protein BDD12DRAFT_831179 [Trichophaea hybrida]|nr:hypothetical protein BDD12DRAFT_831179 [Trichophaea hybrida]
MPYPTPSFSFSHLSPHSQLSMASHMTFKSLIDFALASPGFCSFLYLNTREVVSECLRTQYGYLPDLSLINYNSPALPAFPEGSEEHQLLLELPLLNYLMLEENLSGLPEHQRFLSLLASSTGTPLSDDDKDTLYGPGVRGLLRYLVHYHTLRKTDKSREARWRKMCAFLKRHYTAWGIHEMAGVYECLCDIVASRMEGVGRDEMETECSYVIVQLEVLNMPARNGRIWLKEKERSKRSDEESRALRREHKMFFWKPARDALVQMVEHKSARGESETAKMDVSADDMLGNSNAEDSVGEFSGRSTVEKIGSGLLERLSGTKLEVAGRRRSISSSF